MRKGLWGILILLLMVAVMPLAAAPKSTTITVWTWEPKENQQKIIDAFNKDHPEIKVEFSYVADVDMIKRLQTALASGSDLPDAAWMEISYRGKLIALNCWEDFSKFGVDKKNIVDFIIPVSTNAKGELLGLEVSPAYTGMAYKRDLAKQYFGTDDPLALQKMIPDWPSMLEKGKEIKEKSGGKVYLFSGIDMLYTIVSGQSSTPWVVDNKFIGEKTLRSTLSTLIDFCKAGVIDKMESFSAPWNASFMDSSIIFYPCATWVPKYVIKEYDPDGKGRWGVMNPPGGAMAWGGTIVGIPKKAKNKAAAATFLKWCYYSDKGAKANLDTLGYFSTMKSVYADPAYYSNPDAYFAGQDVLKYFAQEARPKMVPSRPVTSYDTEVNDAISLALADISASTTGDLSVDALMKKVLGSIHERCPDIK